MFVNNLNNQKNGFVVIQKINKRVDQNEYKQVKTKKSESNNNSNK